MPVTTCQAADHWLEQVNVMLTKSISLLNILLSRVDKEESIEARKRTLIRHCVESR